MRLTNILCQQHIGRMVRRHWYVHTRKKPYDLRTDQTLRNLGIEIVDPLQVVSPPRVIPEAKKFDFSKLESPIPVYSDKPPKQDRSCYSYNDSSLFIDGLDQALLLLKTVQIDNKLPENVESLITSVPKSIDDRVQRIIKTSTLFDAHQEKLPKRKHPEKLMWNYARDYGITHIRKAHSLCYKLLHLCDLISGSIILNERSQIFNGATSVLLEKESDLFQLDMTADIMITSNTPLLSICPSDLYSDKSLPDIYPSHPLMGVNVTHNYNTENNYPIDSSYAKHHLHTIFVYYDIATMKNITERPIKEEQILARSLTKCFAAAASYAKQRFGLKVKDLPEPVTVQCVHCDGQKFHFSIFQLNTLNVDGTDGLKNYWWSEPRLDLYEKSSYEVGIPVIEGYNPEVFKRIVAFHKNL